MLTFRQADERRNERILTRLLTTREIAEWLVAAVHVPGLGDRRRVHARSRTVPDSRSADPAARQRRDCLPLADLMGIGSAIAICRDSDPEPLGWSANRPIHACG